MAKTHRCYCDRCHGKFVCKSTYYNHNPGGTGRTRDRAESLVRRTANATSTNTLARGRPSPNASMSGSSMDVISEEGMVRTGEDSHRSDTVRIMANLIYMSEITNRVRSTISRISSTMRLDPKLPNLPGRTSKPRPHPLLLVPYLLLGVLLLACQPHPVSTTPQTLPDETHHSMTTTTTTHLVRCII